MAVVDVFKTTFTEWYEDEAPRLGAALAYYAVFSMAPLLVIIIAVVTIGILDRWPWLRELGPFAPRGRDSSAR